MNGEAGFLSFFVLFLGEDQLFSLLIHQLYGICIVLLARKPKCSVSEAPRPTHWIDGALWPSSPAQRALPLKISRLSKTPMGNFSWNQKRPDRQASR